MWNWLRLRRKAREFRPAYYEEPATADAVGAPGVQGGRTRTGKPFPGESAIPGDRGISPVSEPAFRSRSMPLAILTLVVGTIILVWMVPAPKPGATRSRDDPHATENLRFDEHLPEEKLVPADLPAATNTANVPLPQGPLPPGLFPRSASPPAPLPDAPSVRPPKSLAPSLPVPPGNDPTPLQRRVSSKLLVIDGVAAVPEGTDDGVTEPSAGRSSRGPGSRGSTEDDPVSPLASALRPSSVPATQATRISDRDFTIARGTFLDCALQTALSSDVPGMASCTLTRPVYGDNARVILLDRGTQLTGEYRGGVDQGHARLFVLWTRAKTPEGVVIEINSPGTDALGRSGLDGFVDTHFWQRFGAALLLSSVDDALSILVASEQKNAGANGAVVYPQSTIQTPQTAASIAIGNDVHIQPTLVKNQGDHINVFVARDLDFKAVYALRLVERP